MPNGECTVGADLSARVKNLEEDRDEVWSAINLLRNRLPVWATVVLMAMSALLGSVLTYASVLSRSAHLLAQ